MMQKKWMPLIVLWIWFVWHRLHVTNSLRMTILVTVMAGLTPFLLLFLPILFLLDIVRYSFNLGFMFLFVDENENLIDS
jgi:hypothetical protein